MRAGVFVTLPILPLRRQRRRIRNVPYNASVTRPTESLANPRLWLAFTTMLLISGFPNVYILFLPSLLGEFHASRATTALPMSLVWIGGAVLGPAAGWLVARRNPDRKSTRLNSSH